MDSSRGREGGAAGPNPCQGARLLTAPTQPRAGVSHEASAGKTLEVLSPQQRLDAAVLAVRGEDGEISKQRRDSRGGPARRRRCTGEGFARRRPKLACPAHAQRESHGVPARPWRRLLRTRRRPAGRGARRARGVHEAGSALPRGPSLRPRNLQTRGKRTGPQAAPRLGAKACMAGHVYTCRPLAPNKACVRAPIRALRFDQAAECTRSWPNSPGLLYPGA